MRWCVRVFAYLLVTSGCESAATYYVRPDGGAAKQCTGEADAPYSGHGSKQPCAWSHPAYALKSPTEWKLRGGGRLLLTPASYRMGLGGKHSAWGMFDDARPADAHLPPLPSGPDAAHPTVLAGAGYDSGCARKPKLWGSAGARSIVDLSETANATVACLELTDHATCGDGNPELRCAPEDEFAVDGIYSRGDRGAGILLRDLWIHGLASAGILGHFGAVTMDRVTISGNAMAGWDTDIKTRGPFSPIVKIDHSVIEWSGCVEDVVSRQPARHGCPGEVEGGYSDGIGTDDQGGFWTITNTVVRYNTQDGIDLLYLNQAGAKVTIDGVTAYGNAGNQVKVAGEARITNNVIVGSCSFFDGQPFSIMTGYFWEDATDYHKGDHCRANGDALVVIVPPGGHSQVWNNTIVGEGDFLIWGDCRSRDGSPCAAAGTVEVVNNVLRGYQRKGEFRDKKFGTSGSLVHSILAGDGVFRVVHHNLFFNHGAAQDGLKGVCPMGAGDVCADPHFANDVISADFDGELLPGSPARGAGVPLPALTTDHDGNPRPSGQPLDLGAFQTAPAGSVR